MNTKIKIVVLNEHTFGYILPELPTDVQILHSSILKGSPFGINQSSAPIRSGDVIRLATSQDFNEFRVVESNEYKNPNEYEYFVS
jgi:hypothetical protein